MTSCYDLTDLYLLTALADWTVLVAVAAMVVADQVAQIAVVDALRLCYIFVVDLVIHFRLLPFCRLLLERLLLQPLLPASPGKP